MKNTLTISQASEMLGITKDTLRKWNDSKKLNPIRTKGGHRRYLVSEIQNILNPNQQTSELDILKNKTITYTYVCADILHRGHLHYLKNAAKLGDMLVVGVLTDDAVMELKEPPIVPFDERIELVQALKFVDIAIPQYKYSPCDNIKLIKPDFVLESESHDKKLIEEVKKVTQTINSKVIVAPYYKKQSSTNIKAKIEERVKNERN